MRRQWGGNMALQGGVWPAEKLRGALDYVDKPLEVACEDLDNLEEYIGQALIGVGNHQGKVSNILFEDKLGGRNFHSEGVPLDGCGSGQRNNRGESDTWKPRGVEIAHGAGHGGHVPPSNEDQHHVLTYPPDEVGAIRITDRDMESLRPESWLRDNIIDFYIMYLERNRLASERRGHVYFFNSFFFPKLVASADQGKIDYEQVRNWTKDVNLFERKYIFIPVNHRSHWSLFIMCNFADKQTILHLDSLKDRHDIIGNYDDVESYIQQYIIEAWNEKHHAGSDCPFGSLYSMDFVQAVVPQQDNGYDCGIYLLHYIERFLQHLPPEFATLFANQIPGIWFESSEVSMKRKEIEVILLSLSQVPRTCFGDKGAQCAATKPAHDPPAVELTMQDCEGLPITPLSKPRKDKRKRDSNWTDDETQILVNCKKEAAGDIRSRFGKGKPDVTNWDAIAEEINAILGTMSISKTGDQCRLRWDTLIRSYRKAKEHCTSCNKKISELTRKERVELKLATTQSSVLWFQVIDQFCPPKPRKNKSRNPGSVVPNGETLSRSLNPTRFSSPPQIGIGNLEAGEPSTKEAGAMQDMAGFNTMSPVASDPPVKTEVGRVEPQESLGEDIGLAPVIPGDLNPASFTSAITNIQRRAPNKLRKSSQKQVAIPGFSSMSQDLRTTIVNMVQAWPTLGVDCGMEIVCRWLAIVQNRSPLEARSCVFNLLRRNLLDIWSGSKMSLGLSHLRVYMKFVKVVISKNLNYSIHSRILKDEKMSSFESSSMLQEIRVLTLYCCPNLVRVHLEKLAMLRSLSIQLCTKLEEIIGWESLRELGWLEIRWCDSFHGHPRVHCLPSLKEFSLEGNDLDRDDPAERKLDFSHCLRLRKVRMVFDFVATTVDLSGLKYLEELVVVNCVRVKSVVGLSELHSLTKLMFTACPALKSLPHLGHFKALAKLTLFDLPGVESITGFEDLPSLSHLVFRECSALKSLPDLGGLKALTWLEISLADVIEIRGFEKLHSLTHLDLRKCKALKRIAYWGHLKDLADLNISDTGLDEIPGVRELVNLKTLDCRGSQLEWLPDLGHLPCLERVHLRGTPLVRVPSSKYFRKEEVKFNKGVDWTDEMVDMIDPDYVPSDQEVFDEDFSDSDSSDSDLSDSDSRDSDLSDSDLSDSDL